MRHMCATASLCLGMSVDVVPEPIEAGANEEESMQLKTNKQTRNLEIGTRGLANCGPSIEISKNSKPDKTLILFSNPQRNKPSIARFVLEPKSWEIFAYTEMGVREEGECW